MVALTLNALSGHPSVLECLRLALEDMVWAENQQKSIVDVTVCRAV